MQPAQPPQDAPRATGARNWFQSLSSNGRMVVVLVGVFAVLFCTCGSCLGVASALNGGTSATGTTGASARATNTPSSAETATTGATATATVAATATATPRPLTRQQVAQGLVETGLGDSDFAAEVKSWSVDSDDKAKAFVVTITLDTPLDINAAQTEIKDIAYYVERDFYTSGKMSINDVDIAFRGPVVDKYGKESTGSYGFCDLTFDTATKFVWGNLTFDQAWDAYDSQGLRQS